MRVAVVGATGAVGTDLLRLLRLRSFPAPEVVPFANMNTPRPTGSPVPIFRVGVPAPRSTLLGDTASIVTC